MQSVVCILLIALLLVAFESIELDLHLQIHFDPLFQDIQITGVRRREIVTIGNLKTGRCPSVYILQRGRKS